MLGYRSLFTVEADGVIAAVHAQLHSWLRNKRYDADALRENAEVAYLDEQVEAVLTTEHLQDGSRSTLFALREDRDPNGAWVSQVIAHEPASARTSPWVWIDIEQEGALRRVARTPNLARGLLDVLPAQDGGASLAASPTLVDIEGVQELKTILTSSSRRGPVFVAGSNKELPLANWSQYVGQLLNDTIGLAAGYVLDPEATAALTEIVGGRHGVAPGTLRTYLPGVDPESDLDALRHRFLTTDTILNTPRGRIERILGQRARDTTLGAPVPRWAARVESRLLTATDQRVLGWRPTALVETTDSPPPAEEAPTDELRTHATPTASAGAEVAAQPESESLLRQFNDVSQAHFGRDFSANLLNDLIEARTQQLLELARAEESIRHLSSRTTRLNQRVLSLEAELADSHRQSEDALLEWALADEENSNFQNTIRELHKRLAKAQATDAWEPIPAVSGLDVEPDSFASLLVRLREFRYLRFTLDEDRTSALDSHQTFWAAKAWKALRALDDYARGKADGVVLAGVDHYLANPPVGFATYSANRHARDESEEVKNNPKFSNARVFPVPTTVSQTGEVFMGAHFKIMQYGIISPRLHYYDATSIDGHVYVGHLGEHLPTGMTN